VKKLPRERDGGSISGARDEFSGIAHAGQVIRGTARDPRIQIARRGVAAPPDWSGHLERLL
jgi:hypothetical protein